MKHTHPSGDVVYVTDASHRVGITGWRDEAKQQQIAESEATVAAAAELAEEQRRAEQATARREAEEARQRALEAELLAQWQEWSETLPKEERQRRYRELPVTEQTLLFALLSPQEQRKLQAEAKPFLAVQSASKGGGGGGGGGGAGEGDEEWALQQDGWSTTEGKKRRGKRPAAQSQLLASVAPTRNWHQDSILRQRQMEVAAAELGRSHSAASSSSKQQRSAEKARRREEQEARREREREFERDHLRGLTQELQVAYRVLNPGSDARSDFLQQRFLERERKAAQLQVALEKAAEEAETPESRRAREQAEEEAEQRKAMKKEKKKEAAGARLEEKKKERGAEAEQRKEKQLERKQEVEKELRSMVSRFDPPSSSKELKALGERLKGLLAMATKLDGFDEELLAAARDAEKRIIELRDAAQKAEDEAMEKEKAKEQKDVEKKKKRAAAAEAVLEKAMMTCGQYAAKVDLQKAQKGLKEARTGTGQAATVTGGAKPSVGAMLAARSRDTKEQAVKEATKAVTAKEEALADAEAAEALMPLEERIARLARLERALEVAKAAGVDKGSADRARNLIAEEERRANAFVDAQLKQALAAANGAGSSSSDGGASLLDAKAGQLKRLKEAIDVHASVYAEYKPSEDEPASDRLAREGLVRAANATLRALQKAEDKRMQLDTTLAPIKAYLMQSLCDWTESDGDIAASMDRLTSGKLWDGARVDVARLMMRCLLEASSKKTLPNAIREREVLLRKYFQAGLQASEQMAVLFEVQAFCMSKGWPTKLMKKLFYQLYERDVILEEAYELWRDDAQDDTPGKDRALSEVKEFLHWLESSADVDYSD